MEQTQPQRIAYFDVLRILATFAVIVLHLSAQHWADTDVYSRAWQAFNLYDSAVRWAVPVFVMISGALFLSGSQSIGHILKKNVSRLVTAFIFWSALYAVFMVNFEGCPTNLILQQFLNGHYHMWFLFMIVGLYLIVPFLRPIVRVKSSCAIFYCSRSSLRSCCRRSRRPCRFSRGSTALNSRRSRANSIIISRSASSPTLCSVTIWSARSFP